MLKKETRVLRANIPAALAKKINVFADRRSRSMDWIVEQALTAWIAEEEEHDRLTYEALADVTANRVIDNPAVQTWADSLGNDVLNQTPPHTP